MEKSSLEKLALECGPVILPLPVTDDGVNLKAEYSAEPIVLDDIFAEKMRGKRVFGGKMERLFARAAYGKRLILPTTAHVKNLRCAMPCRLRKVLLRLPCADTRGL